MVADEFRGGLPGQRNVEVTIHPHNTDPPTNGREYKVIYPWPRP